LSYSASSRSRFEAIDAAESGEDDVPAPRRAAETELDFYTRRALEESRLAKRASTAEAAAAHLYLAAAYSAEIAKELEKSAELEQLALLIP
jgi:hypothetical protein